MTNLINVFYSKKALVSAIILASILTASIAIAATFNNDSLDRPTLRVMNKTKSGNTNTAWSTSVTADPGDEISFAVYYHNTSNEVAQNVRISFSPKNTGTAGSQMFSAHVWADNAAPVSGTVTVNLTSPQSMNAIPGTVTWRPNQMTTGSTPFPNGQSGEEIFVSGGVQLGNIAADPNRTFVNQGSVVLGFRVGQTVAPIAPTVDLNADRTVVNSGESFTLSWTSANANTCFASGGWSGTKSISGSQIITPTFTRTYTLTCSSSAGQQASDSVTVTVQSQPLPTVDITVSPSIIQQGNSATLSWTSTNADFCTASGGWSGNKSTSGSESVSPLTSTSYSLTCFNSRGQASDSVTLNVTLQPLPTVNLTANPGTITDGNTSVLNWTSTNADTCFASGGWSGTKPFSGSQVVSPSINTTYTITCSNARGQASDSVTVLVNQLQNFPTVNLTASPSNINQGNSSVLSWSSTNADTCTASGGWSGNKSLSGSQTVTPSVNTSYTITCFNSRGQASDSVTVFVNQAQAVTVTLSANPTSITQGNSSVLNWNSTNADTCTASSGWAGSKGLSGSQTVSPSVNTTYTITCQNSTGQSDTSSVTVFVNQLQNFPTVNLTASPSNINQGNSSVLSWSSTNADSCIASGGWSGTKPFSGSQVVSPSINTTYTITCSNARGQATDSVTVFVNQIQNVTVSLSANPSTITQGNSSVLSWSSANAVSCTASGGWSGSKSLSGSQTVSPSVNTTYTITCQNSTGQSDTSSVTVFVNQLQSFPTVNLTASPTSINQGNTSVLSWTSTNADTCTASGGWSGNKSVSGSQTVTPGVHTSYTITCFNSRGQASDSVTVLVNQVQAAPTLVLRATPTVINRGDTSSLTWDSDNTTSCVASGGWSGSKSLSGSQVVTPQIQTNYVMTCAGPGGSVTAEALVSVIAPVIPSVLGASCGVSDTSVVTGESVVFSAFQSGGRAPFTYIWSGAVQGGGVSRTASFTTTGAKTATVTVTDADGRSASGSCTTSVSARTGAVLGEQSPTCEVKKVLSCTDGKIYFIDASGNAYDKSGKLIYSGGLTNGNDNSGNNSTGNNNTGSDATDKDDKDKKTASLFLTENGELSRLGFLLMWYFLILLAIGFAALMFRLIKGRSVNY